MTKEIPKVRPAVISLETCGLLKDFLGFRHLIGNLYTFDIDKDGIRKLLDKLPETLLNIEHDLKIFCNLLVTAINEDCKE